MIMTQCQAPANKNRVAIVLAVLFAAMYLTTNASAATYYIDYQTGSDTNAASTKDAPWQKCPGMAGFSGSYVHSAGDVFVFKGGVTWPVTCFPMTVANSGTAGNVDTFTVDQNWYSGDSYSRPIFDGENSLNSSASLISISGCSYVKINGLKMVNIGVSGTLGDSTVIGANGLGNGIEISENEIIGYCRHGFKLHLSAASTITDAFKIRNNKMSHLTNFIESGITDTGTSEIHGVEISGNEFFDPHSQLVDGDHGDGIHIFNVTSGHAFVHTGILIFNNKWYGDWSSGDSITSSTANIYFEYAVRSAKIYNNSFTFSNTSSLRPDYMISPGFITANVSESIEIYNNSLCAANMSSGSGAYGVSTGIQTSGGAITVRGNTIVGTRYGIVVGTGWTTIDFDYNVVKPRTTDGFYGVYDFGGPSQTFCSTLDQWQSKGLGLHSINQDPIYISATNLSLQSESPAIAAFPVVDAPTSLFTTDILGISRPNDYWSIGAYEYRQLYKNHGSPKSMMSRPPN